MQLLILGNDSVIISKEKTSPPEDIEKFYSENVVKQIKQEFLKVLS